MYICKLKGGLNCWVAVKTDKGGLLAIAKAEDGSLFGDFGPNKKAASKAAQAHCEAAGMKCKIIKVEQNYL